jgi:NADPH:quinone reductase-like Zn-dependent oxidoreductase
MGPVRPRDKVLGQELSGVIVAIGDGATRFQPGDSVFGTTGFRFGAYAEFICLPESSRDGALALKPATMSYEEAATVPTGGLEALHFLRRAGTLAGRRVLINGAGGGIGIPAIQLAKHFGAEVTGVDAPGKLDLMRTLGADRVIDYTRQDFAEMGESYDVIFDVVGTSRYSKCLRILRPNGQYLLGNPSLVASLRGRGSSVLGRIKVVVGSARPTPEDLQFLGRLADDGKLRTVIDRTFPLEQVPEAHRYIDGGFARGRIAISLDATPG